VRTSNFIDWEFEALIGFGRIQLHPGRRTALLNQRPELQVAGRRYAPFHPFGLMIVESSIQRISSGARLYSKSPVPDQLRIQASIGRMVDIFEEDAVHRRAQRGTGTGSIDADARGAGFLGGHERCETERIKESNQDSVLHGGDRDCEWVRSRGERGDRGRLCRRSSRGQASENYFTPTA